MKILTGHHNFETAYKIENYPWGFRLRTTMYVWIETLPKKGDRVCRQTIDPRDGKLCEPKKSTFAPFKYLYMDETTGHVHSAEVSRYGAKDKILAAIEKIGRDNILPEQMKQLNALMGINEVAEDEFTGKPKKDYSVKWSRETVGQGWVNGSWNPGEKGNYDEVVIRFDRPDGVKLIEMLRAMKALDQDKLNQVFAERPSSISGTRTGVVRIYCRNSAYLGEISESTYREWLASDTNVMEEENLQGQYKISNL